MKRKNSADRKGRRCFYCISGTCLLRKHLLEPGIAGQGVLGGALGLTLDEGQSIVDEVLGDALAVGKYPLGRDLLLEVGNAGQRNELRDAVVLTINILTGWAWPKPSVALVLASETKLPSA